VTAAKAKFAASGQFFEQNCTWGWRGRLLLPYRLGHSSRSSTWRNQRASLVRSARRRCRQACTAARCRLRRP